MWLETRGDSSTDGLCGPIGEGGGLLSGGVGREGREGERGGREGGRGGGGEGRGRVITSSCCVYTSTSGSDKAETEISH